MTNKFINQIIFYPLGPSRQIRSQQSCPDQSGCGSPPSGTRTSLLLYREVFKQMRMKAPSIKIPQRRHASSLRSEERGGGLPTTQKVPSSISPAPSTTTSLWGQNCQLPQSKLFEQFSLIWNMASSEASHAAPEG